MEDVVIKYLRKIKLNVAEKYCQHLISSHPDYPGIISVADTFDQLGIQYAVGRKDEKGLQEIPFPYLLHVNPSHLLLIEDEKDYAKNEENVRTAWSGIIVKVEDEQKIHDPINEEHLDKERSQKLSGRLLIIALGLLSLFPLWVMPSAATAIWLVTAMAGFFVGLILIKNELGIAGKKIKDFCSSEKGNGCEAVLGSQEAVLFKRFKLTDLVAAYFTFQLISIALQTLFIDTGAAAWSSISLVGILAMGMITYSIFSQAFVLKAWCKLCLIVVSILLVQAVLSVQLLWPVKLSLSVPDLLSLGISAVIFLVALSAVVQFKGRFGDSLKLQQHLNNTMRVFQSPAVFDHLMAKEPVLSPFNSATRITIGNPYARLTLTLVLNLSCKPCKESFEAIYRSLKGPSSNIRINLFFMKDEPINVEISDDQYLIQYWLDHIQGKRSEQDLTADLIYNWYNKRDRPRFEKKYPLHNRKVSDQAQNIIDDQTQWLMANGIATTPIYFLNGRHVPSSYRAEHLLRVLFLFSAELESTMEVQQEA